MKFPILSLDKPTNTVLVRDLVTLYPLAVFMGGSIHSFPDCRGSLRVAAEGVGLRIIY